VPIVVHETGKPSKCEAEVDRLVQELLDLEDELEAASGQAGGQSNDRIVPQIDARAQSGLCAAPSAGDSGTLPHYYTLGTATT